MRQALANAFGPNGEVALDVVRRIVNGEVYVPRLDDGREGPPQIASQELRMQAARWVLEMLGGKAVPQTEIVAAERAGMAHDDLRAMGEAQLLGEVQRVLREKKLEGEVDAEIVPVPEAPMRDIAPEDLEEDDE